MWPGRDGKVRVMRTNSWILSALLGCVLLILLWLCPGAHGISRATCWRRCGALRHPEFRSGPCTVTRTRARSTWTPGDPMRCSEKPQEDKEHAAQQSRQYPGVGAHHTDFPISAWPHSPAGGQLVDSMHFYEIETRSPANSCCQSLHQKRGSVSSGNRKWRRNPQSGMSCFTQLPRDYRIPSTVKLRGYPGGGRGRHAVATEP